MGTGGYLLAGALQGIGAGMVAQGQAAAKTEADEVTYRREVALENLRNQNAIGRDTVQSGNRMKEQESEYVLRDRNDARSAQRDVLKSTTLKAIDFKNDVSMARLKASLDRANDAAGLQLRAAIENGQVSDLKEGADGNLYAIFKDGRTTNTGIKFAPKAGEDGGATLGARKSGGDATVPYAAGQQPKTLKFDANGNIIG